MAPWRDASRSGGGAGRRRRPLARGCGRRSCAVNAYPALYPAGAVAGCADAWRDGPSLLGSLWVTLRITLAALAAAVCSAARSRILFAQSRLLERCLFPYAVILQVTPIVVDRAADHHLGQRHVPVAARLRLDRRVLSDRRQHHAWPQQRRPQPRRRCSGSTALRSWQVLAALRLPSALPYFLAGVRISGGLALIGAVVAEFVAGTGGAETGLASRILEAGYRLEIRACSPPCCCCR